MQDEAEDEEEEDGSLEDETEQTQKKKKKKNGYIKKNVGEKSSKYYRLKAPPLNKVEDINKGIENL